MTVNGAVECEGEVFAQVLFRVEFGGVCWEFLRYLTLGWSPTANPLGMYKFQWKIPEIFLGSSPLGLMDFSLTGAIQKPIFIRVIFERFYIPALEARPLLASLLRTTFAPVVECQRQ